MKKRKSQIFKYDQLSRIVAFGDSLTAGSETLDYLHPWNELKQKGQEHFYKVLSREDPNSDFRKALRENDIKQLTVSYPNRLAKSLNLNVINYAQGGNSLEKICFDLLTGQFIPNKDDLILIGLPPPGRYLYFNEHMIESIQPGHLELCGWEKLDLNTMANFYSDAKIIWDYVLQLSLLKNYKDTIHNHLLIIPQWHEIERLVEKFPLPKYCSHLEETLNKLINSDLFLFNKSCLMYLEIPMTKLEFGHPDKHTHLRFAQYLCRYFNR